MNIPFRRWAKRAAGRQSLPPAGHDQVLLTFDDGPHPERTIAVLDLLRRHKARAVFFVVGSRIHRAPGLLPRILAEGHLLGNHSFAHPLDRTLGPIECIRDLRECQRLVRQLTGIAPQLYRPPFGRVSVGAMLAPRLLGLKPILWSVNARDWLAKTPADVDQCREQLLTALSGRPLREIVLFHDEQPNTPAVLAGLLPVLASRGIDLSGGAGALMK